MQPLNTEGAEETAGNALYMRFAPTIFAYLSRQVANLQDAEDLLLEVFLKAHQEAILEELPEERQLAWLRRVARNTVIDRYRHTALLALLPLEQAAEMEDDQLTLSNCATAMACASPRSLVCSPGQRERCGNCSRVHYVNCVHATIS
jgi:DNA-directed RNA polymerase specialized sigma24 family protein